MIRFRRFASAVLVAALCVPLVQAYINASFTPIHLVKESTLIASVDLKQGASKDTYLAEIRQVLKGKTELKSFRMNLTKARDAETADALRSLAAAGKPALFFVTGNGTALLHVGGEWGVFYGKEGLWAFDSLDKSKQGIWAGGTDMLHRAVDYVLQDEGAVLPSSEGVTWSKGPVKVAALGGTIGAVRSIDIAGNGKLVLFVACEKGDRCFACDGKDRKFTDITTARGLQSKSQAFAWGDFAGQGRLDLVSFDGKAISLHAQQADGKFQSPALDLGKAMEQGCVALTSLDCGVKGRSGLLVSGNSWPVLVILDGEGKATATALPVRGVELAKLGKLGACLVADFDGDGLADVLLPAEEGSVFFRSTAPGKFMPGVPCAVKLGKSPSAACLGDFDGDGRLDVFCVNQKGSLLWENAGDGKFTEVFEMTGELSYGASRRGIDCMAGDINNDGRQDVLIAYGAASPKLFFNRGFRTFGDAAGLNLAFRELLPAAIQGQSSACLADLDGDSAQDLALALNNGEVWVVFRENSNPDRQAMMAVATLPVGGSNKGPVTVTGWNGKRCLGAWNVLPGVSHACFGRDNAGPVTLKWRLPGGKEQSKDVVLEKAGTVKVEIK